MAGNYDNLPSALQNSVINNIQICKEIGRGANGRILEAKWEGIVVAVKEIHSIFVNEVSNLEFQSFKRSFLRECEQSSLLRHPNLVRFFGIYHPPGAKVPNLVMERLFCSLSTLLEENPALPIGTKKSIINDVALGIRYLHTRNPPIIHRDLSSNNVLLSKKMEGKIGDLGTARLVDPKRQSRMTKAPGTVDFMPPEALEDVTNIHYGRELDVFSFGCVMLHTLSHQWPTPSQAVITNPETGLVIGGRSEVERRSRHFEKIDRSRLSALISLIESCLSNLPKNRPSIVRVCDQLQNQLQDQLVGCSDSEQDVHELTMPVLQQLIQQKNTELQRKDNEIQRKNAEIQLLTTTQHDKDVAMEALRCDMSILQVMATHLQMNKINKSTSNFWSTIELTWQPCANLPYKGWILSVAEMDGKVYATMMYEKGGYVTPFIYDPSEDRWSSLPALPYIHFSLVAVPDIKQLLAIGGMVNMYGVAKVTNKVFLWDENDKNWTNPYPKMPTARYRCASVSHGLNVIVAGGKTCQYPFTMTRAVEVLHIQEHNSYWHVVEQLPHIVREAIPLMVNDKLYIAQGCDGSGDTRTCNIVTASLPELLQSSDKKNNTSHVWNKLPDMPFSSFSISHYEGYLITFSGSRQVEQPSKGNPVWQLVSLIHIYNPNTKTWDCVGDIPHGYILGRSIHIKKNKILFLGGLTGTHCLKKDDDMVITCSLLTLSHRDGSSQY